MKKRHEAPKIYKGKIVECDCNNFEGDVHQVEYLEGKYERYACPRCGMYPWISKEVE